MMWVFIGRASGMPLEVQKCDFKPTVGVARIMGDWIEYAEPSEIWLKAADDIRGWISLQKKHYASCKFVDQKEALREHKNQLNQLGVLLSKFLKNSGMEPAKVFRELIKEDVNPEGTRNE